MIDLNAYLHRVGFSGPHEPTLEVLRQVCALHPAAIAFENIDPFLERPPSLAPAALEAKLVAGRRGGYCYEQNALLRLALMQLGMQVTSLAAEVLWMAAAAVAAPARPRTHMLLNVALPRSRAESYLVDAGFGGHLLAAPLVFEPGRVQHTPAGTERITRDGPLYALEALLPDGWTPAYRFTLEAQRPVDFEPPNWFTATHPSSLLRHNLRLERLTSQTRASLFNDRLTLRPAAGAAQSRRLVDAADLADVLHEVFDIASPCSADELFARIPRGLEGAYLPDSR